MAAMNEGDWSKLCHLPAWIPICELDWDTTLVESDVYRIGEGAYALAQPITRDLREGDPRAPFLTVLYWAPSDGAVRRVALNHIDDDDGAEATPPRVLWMNAELPTYGVLLRAGRAHAEEGCTERATYAADGRFVHKVIDFGNRQFYFRQVDVNLSERPYAVGVLLSD